ncbi:uncharacterized protein LOC106136674 [Amyelois transitella]|uniref:uncharacterized protein LOC106136674 n=1 Tax=Amyelois transitella TaxID=680683 RepID=UPI00298FDF9C|nr:uncharacterized protein LOC106136674 [Amyelois transitella]
MWNSRRNFAHTNLQIKRKKEDFEKCLASQLADIIKNIGLSTNSKINKVTWWANMATASFVVYCCLQTVALVTAQDSKRLFECFSVLSFCMMGIIKLFSLRMYRKRWLHLLAQMKKLENNHIHLEIPDGEYESDNESLDMTTFVQDYTAQFDETSSLLSRVYRSTAVVFILSPFIEYIYLNLTGGSSEYPHILPCWAPLDKMHIVGYLVTIIFECIAAIYCVVVHLAFDCSSAGVMIFVKGQFLLLRKYTENIAGKGKKCDIIEKRDKRANYRIKYSHQTSILLKNIVKEFENLLKNIMGIYYSVVTLTLCSVAMRLKTEVLSPAQLLSLLQYLGEYGVARARTYRRLVLVHQSTESQKIGNTFCRFGAVSSTKSGPVPLPRPTVIYYDSTCRLQLLCSLRQGLI